MWKLNGQTISGAFRIADTQYPPNWLDLAPAEEKAELGITWEDPPEPTPEELEQRRQSNLESLWQAATSYQEGYISGAAIGLLTIGVLQSKPKCLAVMAWISAIWNDNYYPRKLLVTPVYNATLNDFTDCGAMPYSVPELTAEVFGG